MKIWYLICSFFFLVSFNILIEEGKEIVYKSIDKSEPYSYLICTLLKRKFKNHFKKIVLDLDQLSEDMQSYFKNLKNSIEKYDKKIFNETRFNELILDPIESRNYLIFDDRFCFIRGEFNLADFEFILSFLKDKDFFLFKKDTYDFYKLKVYWKKVDQLVVVNKQYPHSNCIENYSKFACLNRCFKKKYRLSKYFFTSEESGIIYLDYEYNQTIKNYENECLNECKRDDCKITNFIPKVKGKSTKTLFEATFLILRIDYLIQLVGLIFYIANIYFYQLLFKLFEFIDSKTKKIKIRRIKKLRKYLIYLKMAIVLVSINCALFYLYEKFKKMKNSTKNEMHTYLTEPEMLNLAICIPVTNILTKDYNSINKHKDIYISKTFSELEEETNRGFNDTVKEIYLKFQDKKIKIDYTMTSKILFRSNNKNRPISRCFQFEIPSNEPKYRSLLARSRLVILLRHAEYELCLLSKDENLKTTSYINSKQYDIKKIKKKLKANCFDYKKKGLNCFDQNDCLNRCVNVKFTEKYKNITTLSIIDKNRFTEDQWLSSFPNENKTNSDLIKKECRKKFQIKDCYEITFETNNEINPIGGNIQVIDLYYDVFSTIEDETSLYKLLIDFVNIQNILFGQNVLKLFVIIYCFLNAKFKLYGSKYYLLLFYFICLSGFAYHTYFTFDQVLNNELIHFVYYTVEESIKMPNVIFCFNLDKKKIDSNFKLTKNYLDEIYYLRRKTVFNKIEYLNKSNSWIDLDLEFKIETLYLLDKKCFKIKQKIEYGRNQFYSLENREVLRIYFNRTIIHQDKFKIYFFTKTSDRMQISRINELVFKDKYHYFKFTTSPQTIEYSYRDKFDFVKNPFLLFNSEVNLNSLNDLMNNFESNYNLRSLYLPSENENENSNIEINDGLFEQYCNQIQNIDYSSLFNTNIQKLFIINNLKKEQSSLKNNDPDFTFELNFLKNQIKITNEDNIVKLILSLLNVLSLWCDLCIFDLGVYVYYAYCKIKFIFMFSYKLFIRLNIYLYRYAYCYK